MNFAVTLLPSSSVNEPSPVLFASKGLPHAALK
jgi:hypothetical protein